MIRILSGVDDRAHSRVTSIDQVLSKPRRALSYADLNDKQRRLAAEYFSKTVFPVLTPLAFDPGRPFPHISNLSLNLTVLIRDNDGHEHFVRVKVPDSLPQLVPLGGMASLSSKRPGKRRVDLVWLEEIAAAHLSELFPGMEIVDSYPFHVTRDADIAIRELEADDLLETIEEGVRQRRFGSVVRLVVARDMPASILEILKKNLEIDADDVYRTERPLSLRRLDALYAINRPELKYPPFTPVVPQALAECGANELIQVLSQHDALLHHPFDSFQPVVEFLRAAARDPSVLAIKMCLYRVGRNSPIVEALLEAVEENKQVALLVELKARFDEESNIEWARALERAGAQVATD